MAPEAAEHAGQGTLIVVDPTNIRKLYLRKRPWRDWIRNGSKGELGHGYGACAAVACARGCGRSARCSLGGHLFRFHVAGPVQASQQSDGPHRARSKRKFGLVKSNPRSARSAVSRLL